MNNPSKRKKVKTIISCLSAVAAIIISDQLVKAYVIELLAFQDKMVVNSFINFVLVYNQGISFGFFNDRTTSSWFLITMSLLIVLILFIWMYKTEEKGAVLPIGMIMGGALGNVIDRLTRGAVVDFIDFNIIGWHYPSFNIADGAICIGVVALLSLPLKPKKNLSRRRGTHVL